MTAEVLEFLRASGLAGASESPLIEPLTGGVSSDIWRVELAGGALCVKRALPRLRVAQVWEAPVERNRYERRWLQTVAEIAPDAVPKVLAYDDAGFLAMEYLPPERYPVWKQRLREGVTDPAFASQVGAHLATIHSRTSGSADLRETFATDASFHAIRLEPYLLATAARHADLAQALTALAERTAATKGCLVHGDVSPKNILAGPQGPVFLDAECAWYGDPAFDLAFCLNHLLLKCLWAPQATEGFLDCFTVLADAYFAKNAFENREALESRTATLLPGLFLARVDGKSPVEYLQEPDKNLVRQQAREWLARPVRSLSALRKQWKETLTQSRK